MSLTEKQSKTTNEKRYNRKPKSQIINHKYFKCGYPDCLKQFHDYSSIYTHIKLDHKEIIHPDTLFKPPKKDELRKWMEQEKGEIIQDPDFNIDVDEIDLYFLDQIDLLKTYSIFQDIYDKEKGKLSDFFHKEDQECFDLAEMKYINEFLQIISEENKIYIYILQEYLKPFELDTAKQLGTLFCIAIKEKGQDLNDIVSAMQTFMIENKQKFSKLNDDDIIDQDEFIYTYLEHAVQCFLQVCEEIPQNVAFSINNQLFAEKYLSIKQNNIQINVNMGDSLIINPNTNNNSQLLQQSNTYSCTESQIKDKTTSYQLKNLKKNLEKKTQNMQNNSNQRQLTNDQISVSNKMSDSQNLTDQVRDSNQSQYQQQQQQQSTIGKSSINWGFATASFDNHDDQQQLPDSESQ